MTDVGRAVFASDYQSRKARRYKGQDLPAHVEGPVTMGGLPPIRAEVIKAGTITAECLLSVPSVMYEASRALGALKPGQEIKIIHHGDSVEFVVTDVTEDPA